MRIPSMSNELFRRRAKEENSCMISAVGLKDMFSEAAEGRIAAPQHAEPTRVAFGTLISFRRRALKLSLENLAERARIELDELLRIEDDPTYVPEPRTVHQLAGELKLPTPQLLILSGNASSQNMQLNRAALKFAARSRAVEKLNREETEALNEFVKVLVSQTAAEKRQK